MQKAKKQIDNKPAGKVKLGSLSKIIGGGVGGSPGTTAIVGISMMKNMDERMSKIFFGIAAVGTLIGTAIGAVAGGKLEKYLLKRRRRNKQKKLKLKEDRKFSMKSLLDLGNVNMAYDKNYDNPPNVENENSSLLAKEPSNSESKLSDTTSAMLSGAFLATNGLSDSEGSNIGTNPRYNETVEAEVHRNNLSDSESSKVIDTPHNAVPQDIVVYTKNLQKEREQPSNKIASTRFF